MRDKQSTPISQACYARRRGVTRQAVNQAIAAGILSRCLVRGPDGRMRIASAAQADAEWASNTANGSGANSNGAGSTYAAARARLTAAKAERAELENREREGELVRAAGIKAEWKRIAVLVRNRLLGVPRALRARRPNLSLEDIAEVDGLIRAALEEIAGGEGREAADGR